MIPSSLRANGHWKDSLRIFLAHVNDVDETWLNGTRIGKIGSFPDDAGGYISKWPAVREYHISIKDPAIKWDEDNVIAVKDYDGGGTGGIFMGHPYLDMLEKTDGLTLNSPAENNKYRPDQKTEAPITIANSFNTAVRGMFTWKVYDAAAGKECSRETQAVQLLPFGKQRFSITLPSRAGIEYSYTFTEEGTGLTVSGRQIVPYLLTPAPAITPRINSAKVVGVRPGSPFLCRIAATGKRPMTYGVTHLPEGLELDKTTGIIKGVLDKGGDYTLQLSATNAAGRAEAALIVKVGEALALTPPMGWNSWNCWGLSVSDEKVRSSARALIDKGLIDHGWTYINIDDGWQASRRTRDSSIVPNEKFSDMKALGDWLHDKGLKFGIYSSPGPLTCGGYLGSWMNEARDADSYASWGVDYLKYDWCSYDGIVKDDTSLAAYIKPYSLMQNALRARKRSIVYSLCQYGLKDVWKWGATVDGQSWRTTEDIEDTWQSLSSIGFHQNGLYPYARPGNWNDPDMMIVGQVGWGENLHPSRLTPDEQYTHVSLWCLLAAPLLIGCDISRLDPFTLNLLTNDEVLAIDQDPLGAQARQLIRKDGYQVWVKELEDGSKAVGIFNMDTTYQKISVDFKDLNLPDRLSLRDPWTQKELGVFHTSYAAYIPPHGVQLVIVNAPAPYQPTRAEIMERYRRAKVLDSLAPRSIYKASVRAHWRRDGSGFWYKNILKDSVPEYIYVDITRGTRQKMSIDSLPKDTIRSRGFSEPWPRWESFSTDSLSPDRQFVAYIKDGNVFVRPAGGGAASAASVNGGAPSINASAAVQFTTDGDTARPYGELAWSPDSKYVVGYHIHPVEDSAVYYVLSSVGGTKRGQLHQHPYKQPGDPFTTYEMFLFTIAGQKTAKVNTPLIDFFASPQLHWRDKDSRYFTYEKVDRGHQRFRIIEVDAETAATRTILDEQTNTFIYESRLYTHYLPATHELLLTSEKDGWRHLYRVDAISGKEQPITRGQWIVRDIDSIDEKKREIWFSASGMNPGEDPYYIHYYRIGFDGQHLVSLTEARANHIVSFSPDRKYYLDAYSEINVPTVTELHRTADGKKILEVERTDASVYLASGLRLPEPFHAKGRDGVTDIWGIVCRPADFDSTKSYPVVENIYAGPQASFVPKDFTSRYGEMQSIAQLGFIVVQIDGMGTANRSKAFHDVCWKNLADAGFPDRILWIKALAAKYPYVDTSRVGLYGTSAGGQNSLGGLLFHGDFYKAAVSSCGCHDNRIDKQWWNEQWMGYPVGKQYEEQSNVTNAWKLHGDLLLMVGEGDNNVPPESTYRVADALIKSGKTFDFLPLPGMDHTDGGPYGRMKRRDFFVKHLLGVDPPQRNL